MDLPVGDANRVKLAAVDEALLSAGHRHPSRMIHPMMMAHAGDRV